MKIVIDKKLRHNNSRTCRNHSNCEYDTYCSDTSCSADNTNAGCIGAHKD